ncbi:MAG TPA: hypothetical protein VMK13_05185, partial [Streptosporangiaceae bacterium]|nr:hypothetical protein [Streptosporangiaceae bacterium]
MDQPHAEQYHAAGDGPSPSARRRQEFSGRAMTRIGEIGSPAASHGLIKGTAEWKRWGRPPRSTGIFSTPWDSSDSSTSGAW